MALAEVLAHIDSEIARLQQARALLTGGEVAEGSATTQPQRGRPKGSRNQAAPAADAAPKGKRNLSPEGRRAIAEAMKRRWAERREKAAS